MTDARPGVDVTAAPERAADEPPGAEVPADAAQDGDAPSAAPANAAGESRGGEVTAAAAGADVPSGPEHSDPAAGDQDDDARADAEGDHFRVGVRAPGAGEPPAAEAAADEPPAPEASGEPPAQQPSAAVLLDALAGLTALGDRVDDIARAAAELSRLRSRDTDLIARLHDDVTRLRTGEIAAALNPVVTGMIKLHDQMVSLGALSDPASPVGMLHTQLLQILELTCAVRPFTPSAGERFDAAHHTGIRRIPTTQASADGTIASTVRAGFVRADGSVVRVAEVEVHRLSG